MKIAVTGGNRQRRQSRRRYGIGSGTQRCQYRPGDIRATMRRKPDITYIQADITDYAALENAFRGCDAVVHMAAIPAPGHLPDHVVHNNNVVGSYNAAACRGGSRHS